MLRGLSEAQIDSGGNALGGSLFACVFHDCKQKEETMFSEKEKFVFFCIAIAFIYWVGSSLWQGGYNAALIDVENYNVTVWQCKTHKGYR